MITLYYLLLISLLFTLIHCYVHKNIITRSNIKFNKNNVIYYSNKNNNKKLINQLNVATNYDDTTIKDKQVNSKSKVIINYIKYIKNKPIISKVITSSIGFLIGDIFAQNLFNKSGFDVIRLLRMGLFGGLIHAPTGHFVYRFIQNIFPGNSRFDVLKKIALDQFIWMPIFSVLFCTFIGVLSGHSPHIINSIIKSKIKYLLLTSWLLWPISHMISFHLVNPKRRILFMNIIQVIYNTLISKILN